MLMETLDVKGEPVAAPHRPEGIQGRFRIGGIEQVRMQPEAMRRQGGTDAVANINTQCASSRGDLSTFVFISDARK